LNGINGNDGEIWMEIHFLKSISSIYIYITLLLRIMVIFWGFSRVYPIMAVISIVLKIMETIENIIWILEYIGDLCSFKLWKPILITILNIITWALLKCGHFDGLYHGIYGNKTWDTICWIYYEHWDLVGLSSTWWVCLRNRVHPILMGYKLSQFPY
jgi:hypothetical protein